MKRCPTPELISHHADGELPPDEARALAEHLRACPACRGLYESLVTARRVLRALYVEGTAQRSARADCPDEETLLAYADGSSNHEERKSIAAHLVVCERCAAIAAEAGQTARLCREVDQRGLEKPPRDLIEKARERFFPKRSDLIGEIAVRLQDLWRQFQEGLAYPVEAIIAPEAVREPGLNAYGARMDATIPCRPPFIAVPDASPRRPKNPAKARPGRVWRLAPPGFQIEVELRGKTPETADLLLRLYDASGGPWCGMQVSLETSGKMITTGRTGKRGGLNFRDLSPDSYRLLFRLPHLRSLALTLQ